MAVAGPRPARVFYAFTLHATRAGIGMLNDELGAHVSTAGGIARAPARAAELESRRMQVFTKQPSRWAEPSLGPEAVAGFQEERRRHGVATVVAHDSYLINLASSDRALHGRSYAAFVEELRRCGALGIEHLVTHPGNATDGDRPRALARNAEAIERALEEAGGRTMVLLETTAGSGTALGASFEELAEMRARIRPALRSRVGICLDTCHVWAAGYDLAGDYDGVFQGLEDTMGLEPLRLFHLNDSLGARGSRRDRHAEIGEGTLGEAPFRRLINDRRFLEVPKLLETPKGKDPLAADRRNLARLRSYRAG